mgnify:CR=1 FL=1|jgi:hypothetical protein
MTNFNAGENGKVDEGGRLGESGKTGESGKSGKRGRSLVAFLILTNLVLIAVVVFLLGRPGLNDLRAGSGKADFLLAVKTGEAPVIYTPSGSAWVKCKEGECRGTIEEISCNVKDVPGFALFELQTDNAQIPTRTIGALGNLLISPANADAPASDGVCPVTAVRVFQNGVVVKSYPPTSEDPDCPPR